MNDYYKGMSTPKLTKKYLPNSPEAKKNLNNSVLSEIVNENIDPVKLKSRPDLTLTPSKIVLNNPKARAEFIKFANAPENRIIDSMEEVVKIAKKYAPEGIDVSDEIISRTTFMNSGLRDLITKPVAFSNPFEGRGERPMIVTGKHQFLLEHIF